MSEHDNPYRSPKAEREPGEEALGAEPVLDEDTPSMSKLTSFMNLSEAQLCQAVLRQEGIESFLENEGAVGINWLWSNAIGGVKVFVPTDQLAAAQQLIDEGEMAKSSVAESADITFECEECGKEITFPGDRRGKVETCPKCHEYVDVPD